MKPSSLLSASLFALACSSVFAATYLLTDDIVGNGFYDSFDWQDIPDPTHGRVNYVDQYTSDNRNLTFASPDSFILRADSTNFLDPTDLGRDSVRIRSKKTYTNHVAIFDVRHMPQGCGTWPAIWETKESNWPSGGETDILEGVNNLGPNAATLHSNPGCSMPTSRVQSGMSGQQDCDASVNGNTGCGVKFPSADSYGPTFNKNGGGWFAIERSSNYIKVWFWARSDQSIPADVTKINGGFEVDPDGWGVPVAHFPDTSCDMAENFHEHHIIINLTLCGDWAGAVFGQAGCPGSCVDFVNDNPSAFESAYFDLAAIRVYE